MITLTATQYKTVEVVKSPEYKHVGCPASAVNCKMLEVLIGKGVLQRGKLDKEKIFIRPPYHRSGIKIKEVKVAEFTNAQIVAIYFISRPEYKWRGCPAYLVNNQTLKSLLDKGAVRRGVSRPSKIFVNLDTLNKLK